MVSFGRKGIMSLYKLAIFLIVFLTLCSAQSAPERLTGTWKLDLAFPAIGIDSIKLELVLEQNGEKLTGNASTATGANPIKGTVTGTDVEFTEVIATGDAKFKGKIVDAKTLKGTMDAPPYGPGNWTATR